MGKQGETVFLEKVDAQLKAAFGDDIVIFNIQQQGIVGDPDRLICLNGHFLAIEGKDEGGTIDTIQLLKLLKVKRAGGFACKISPSTWDRVFSDLKKFYASL